MSQATTIEACRLCGSPTDRIFTKKVLNKYDVGFFRCQGCGSAQTEQPYWLEEAYQSHLTAADTGAAQRVLRNFIAVYLVCRIFKLRNLIDIGGADGLLCRLLRDYELNCFVVDKYAAPTYAQGYTEPDFETPDLLMSFEVFEHFAAPREELAKRFAQKPKVLIATTDLYQNQPEDWWYFMPSMGQHVFFYSRQGLERIAAEHGYTLLPGGGYLVFVQTPLVTRGKRVAVRVFLNERFRKLTRAAFAFIPERGSMKDSEEQIRLHS